MAEQLDPVEARLKFGTLARELRQAVGLEPGEAEAELIRAVGGYGSVLSKIETGKIAPKAAHVAWMVERYRPDESARTRLAELGDVARRRARPVKVGVQSREYLARERRATEIWMVYNEIPGLLQRQDFAYATLSKSPLIDPQDVAGLAEERAERGRRIIRPDGPSVWIVLGEEALDRVDGGPDVVAREFEHLLAVSRMPNVRFRLLPRSAGSTTGLSNPFTLLHTEPNEWLAFVGHIMRNDYIKAVDRFRRVFDQAWDAAASEEATRTILKSRITDLIKR